MTAAGCTVQESGSGKTTNPSSIEQYTMADVEAPARTPSSIPNVDRGKPRKPLDKKNPDQAKHKKFALANVRPAAVASVFVSTMLWLWH